MLTMIERIERTGIKMEVSIATICWQIAGGAVMIVGILALVCIITLLGVTICALFYPSVSKMANGWLNWVKGRFGL